jgi:alpha-1,3-rhamnosyltransferase
MNIENNNSLVSIIVVTYNSEKYVIETLESAKNQTYKNIELIITDDCSIDGTIDLCQNWIDDNYTRFKECKFIKTIKNTGIAPNCNRGLYAAKGDWIKFIAGDDILLENCIETNIGYSLITKQSFYFSMLKYTIENPSIDNIFQNGLQLFNSNKNHFKILLKRNCLPAATAFIRRNVLLELNGFDENYPMLEDYPLWLKALQNYQIIFNPEKTVIYRIHSESTSGNSLNYNKKKGVLIKNFLYRKSWFKFQEDFILKKQAKYLLFYNLYISLIDLLLFKIVLLFSNKRNLLSTILFNFILLFSPKSYMVLFKKKFKRTNNL